VQWACSNLRLKPCHNLKFGPSSVTTQTGLVRQTPALTVGFIPITRYQYLLRIHWPCNIAASRDRTISCTNARLTQTMQNGDNYLRDGHLKGWEGIYGHWPVSDKAPQHLPTHALFDLYFAHSKSSLSDDDDGRLQQRGEIFLGGQHCMPCSCPHHVGQQRWENRKVWSASAPEFDQRSTSADPSNMQSRVCSEATSECHPILIV